MFRKNPVTCALLGFAKYIKLRIMDYPIIKRSFIRQSDYLLDFYQTDNTFYKNIVLTNSNKMLIILIRRRYYA